jgi:large subunit ribosomal protein L3
MAGHLGNVRRTIQNVQILRVDQERGLILVKGGIPGSPGSYVTISKAVKVKREKKG